MSEQELREEFLYRVAERLGIMCGTDVPTDWQGTIAIEEAKKACRELQQQ